LSAAAPALHAGAPLPQRVAETTGAGRSRAGKLFARVDRSGKSDCPAAPRSRPQAFAPGATGLSPGCARGGGIAPRVSTQRENGLRRGTGTVTRSRTVLSHDDDRTAS